MDFLESADSNDFFIDDEQMTIFEENSHQNSINSQMSNEEPMVYNASINGIFCTYIILCF